MSQFHLISVTDAHHKLQHKQACLVDIRDSISFGKAHVQNAFHLTNDSLAEFIKQTEFTTPVMVICYHGHSSRGAAEYLANYGFDEVYSVEGGFAIWQLEYPETIK